jgi:chorismate mutase
VTRALGDEPARAVQQRGGVEQIAVADRQAMQVGQALE